ncbi:MULTISPECIES: GNAT family N-acetyltransferase [Tissierellales]|uniref:GNAT family N-acetyltransferase n=1 Tax=Tissierellales TaxID=1737405 RepID=UPI0008D99E40|nr:MULTISPECIES: GNAT family N-acetyltransferase [Tissierellales]
MKKLKGSGNVNIRDAKKEDIDDIVKMWKELSDYHRNFLDYMHLTENWEENIKNLYSEDLNDANRIFLIAEENNERIGFLRGEVRIALSNIFIVPKSGYISDIFVCQRFRGSKVAESLMNRAIRWFRRNGISNVRLNVNSENIRAIRFYNRIGFKRVNETLNLNV